MTMRKEETNTADSTRRPLCAGRNAACRDQGAKASLATFKRRRPWLFTGMLGGLAVLFSGCSTPGPLHVYSVTPGADTVRDIAVDANDATQPTPSFLNPGDVLTGFAYDPFTDHFFLRLAPGNHVRVVDRPARKIKREFDITDGPPGAAMGSGDLAVCPKDGHIFWVDPSAPGLIETTRLAKYIRQIALRGQMKPAAAVAFDAGADRLLVLEHDGRTIRVFTREGEPAGSITLEKQVEPSLAFDSVRHEYYAPLAGTARDVGIFDQRGHLARTVPLAPGDPLIDVGPHSFLRVF